MRFQKKEHGAIPEIDLIPMLNVMMGILAFFVMITMGLANQAMVEVQVPGAEQGKANDIPELPEGKDLFIVKLNEEGQALLNDQPIDSEQIKVQMQDYLEQEAKGTVYLQPNPQLDYEQVIKTLVQMRAIGGKRVSLVIE